MNAPHPTANAYSQSSIEYGEYLLKLAKEAGLKGLEDQIRFNLIQARVQLGTTGDNHEQR